MTNFIPVFPLAIAVFPGEILNLHIFENEYKQLINDCLASNKPFGIPSVVNNHVTETGTLVNIQKVAKTYDDGNLDIVCLGTHVFRILEPVNSLPGKIYKGAIVTYPTIYLNPVSKIESIVAQIKKLHHLLSVEKTFQKPINELISFDVAHHIGLSLDQECRLMEMPHENQRLSYIQGHLTKTIKLLQNMDALKQRIHLNGHFKDLSGFQFN